MLNIKDDLQIVLSCYDGHSVGKYNNFFYQNFFRTKMVEAARADGEKIRLIGAAEARAVEAVGRAEAERMRMKASAYKQYGDAAILALVLEALPQIAAEVTTGCPNHQGNLISTYFLNFDTPCTIEYLKHFQIKPKNQFRIRFLKNKVNNLFFIRFLLLWRRRTKLC